MEKQEHPSTKSMEKQKHPSTKSVEKQEHPLTWQSHGFRAMGSQVVLWLDIEDKAAAQQAFDEVVALFESNEQALSRFRPTSELSRFNRCSGQWVAVSELLWQQVSMAVQMADLTDGRFDPTLLNGLERAGYNRSFAMVSGDWQMEQAHGFVLPGGWEEQSGQLILRGMWEAIEFNEERRAVRVPEGVQIDLGGISKGDTAQQAVAVLQAAGPCLVDAGGDLAAGKAPYDFPGWPVAISAPGAVGQEDALDLASIWLANGAMATSGVDYRRWNQDGRAMHHLIDPFTGSPAVTDGLTATVLAGEAAQAEAWATAILVAGSAAGLDALLDHDLDGLFITQDGRILVTPGMDDRLQGR